MRFDWELGLGKQGGAANTVELEKVRARTNVRPGPFIGENF